MQARGVLPAFLSVMRLPRIALLAGLCSVTACAAFQPEQNIRVLLPPPPVHWQIAFPRLAFRVAARDSRGAVRETTAWDWQRPVEIECARALNTPILGWPFVPEVPGSIPVGPGFLRPAGGLFPLSLRSYRGAEVVELTWEDGAAASLLDRAAAAGVDVACFNAARLCGYLREHRDPWVVDLDSAAQAISEGRFTAWDIDARPTYEVRVAPGPGRWFLESPFCLPTAAEKGMVFLGGVTRGCHRLFSLAGSCWRLEAGEGGALLAPGP